jgi:hypothetical protein
VRNLPIIRERSKTPEKSSLFASSSRSEEKSSFASKEVYSSSNLGLGSKEKSPVPAKRKTPPPVARKTSSPGRSLIPKRANSGVVDEPKKSFASNSATAR